jgi:uncharacterized membrane protein
MAVEVVVGVRVTAQHLWTVLTDVEHWPEWTPTMTSVTRLVDGPLAVGSRVRIKQPKLGTMVWTVTELLAGQSFVWRATRPGLMMEAGHRVTPLADGTVQLTLSVAQSGPIGRLVEPLTKAMAQRYAQLEAEGHRQRAELPG